MKVRRIHRGQWLSCLSPERQVAGSIRRYFPTRAGGGGGGLARLLYINVWRCGAMFFSQLKDPLGLFINKVNLLITR